MDDNELNTLHSHIQYSPSKCWKDFVPVSARYDPSHSKASALAPSLRYLHAILAHTLTRRRESTGVVNTHDAYFLWSMANGHIFDLAYFIALAIRHQTNGIIIIPHSHRPDVPTGHLEHATYEDDRETTWHLPSSVPPHLAHREEDLEDITDDVPPRHEDPPSQPPPIHHLVHAAASYSNISERLTQLEQQFFHRFDHIDATLHQICQHLHLSSLPPREPSDDDDV
ncbi:hypothetical protein PVK06_003971 [Gossypium arboreum]|uniref:Uncharacterized protein n=1 Tax=Gossypium arboreum TaxID=29729 RepID=A0ABR0QQR3_GOSAR|nr:hypothetical protein PVK06_003971 [Gossypium arboreum]